MWGLTKGKALPVDTSPSFQLDRQHRRVEGGADRLPIDTMPIAEKRMSLVSREREEVIYTVGSAIWATETERNVDEKDTSKIRKPY